jgi:hypothetical protein
VAKWHPSNGAAAPGREWRLAQRGAVSHDTASREGIHNRRSWRSLSDLRFVISLYGFRMGEASFVTIEIGELR